MIAIILQILFIWWWLFSLHDIVEANHVVVNVLPNFLENLDFSVIENEIQTMMKLNMHMLLNELILMSDNGQIINMNDLQSLFIKYGLPYADETIMQRTIDNLNNRIIK